MVGGDTVIYAVYEFSQLLSLQKFSNIFKSEVSLCSRPLMCYFPGQS